VRRDSMERYKVTRTIYELNTFAIP
jgi:hypothetical protein